MHGEKALQCLLGSYPRKRPPLSDAHQKIYIDEYRANRAGSGALFSVVAWLERWMHDAVARPGSGPVLEIGAGTLNHVHLEGKVEYDVIEPLHDLWRDSPSQTTVRNFYDNLVDVPENLRYSRIISVAVLEHLEDLPYTIARSGLMLTETGTFQAGFPSEGGFLWGLSWRLSTGIVYRIRTGLAYSSVMGHEHLNSADEIIKITNYFFHKVRRSRFPLPFHHLSFYTAISASEPRLDRCREFIKSRASRRPAREQRPFPD